MPLVEDQRTLVEASDEEMEVSGFLQTIYHLVYYLAVRLLSWRQFTICQDSLPPIKKVYHLSRQFTTKQTPCFHFHFRW